MSVATGIGDHNASAWLGGRWLMGQQGRKKRLGFSMLFHGSDSLDRGQSLAGFALGSCDTHPYQGWKRFGHATGLIQTAGGLTMIDRVETTTEILVRFSVRLRFKG